MNPLDPAAPPRVVPSSAEVARRAGVSRTTVSFVLNDVRDRGISEATRERVLAVAREIGYEPHAAARMLAGGATGTVALVVPRMAHLSVDAFLSQLVASINAECHRHGLALLIESTEDEGREPGGFLRLVRSRRIDGLIVANLRTQEIAHLQQLRAGGVPLVVFGCQLPEAEGFHTMGDDTWQSARLAVDHLLDLGHRQVAFVNYAQPEFHNVNQRERGWRAALQARGIEPDAAWLAHADISAESGYLATRRLLARGVPFTALFAGNDTIAFGALRALREAGRRVPQDVAVVGYDDIPLAPYADPPLSSVRTDPAVHGRQAVQTLLAQLRPGSGVVDAVPAPVLVVRASCGAAPRR
ncbi:LacI family DNA-binding transcriptional regulator [Rubrivivax rivuli]|uniref:LacI family transcriptional regulator n=1 Tax=Rubrivivax rivuli TaxID=1862385 RepID=A0A437RRE3_9BURK|nr:LacI family DNA-binding transcriptional regulator [Rubrivivax rivuli]RVU49357.1 LacI family transcriptional regulator [Rubrivivax rivuli]